MITDIYQSWNDLDGLLCYKNPGNGHGCKGYFCRFEQEGGSLLWLLLGCNQKVQVGRK